MSVVAHFYTVYKTNGEFNMVECGGKYHEYHETKQKNSIYIYLKKLKDNPLHKT